MSNNVILITGAGGFLGSLLARTLISDSAAQATDVKLILADVVQPKSPHGGPNVLAVQANLTDPTQADALFNTAFGVPDTVYCLHGIMSRGSEDNFDLGIKVNVDSVRSVLDAARHAGERTGTSIKFIFASSLAVYGGPLPEIVTPETIATPQSAYGAAKLIDELFINEYTRRGFVDGRILRLPTIAVRPGPPAAASSAFISAIIREPLQGAETTCPIGDSLTSPALDALALWLASPETTVRNFILARSVPASAFAAHTRVVCLPGFTATVRDELSALERVAGPEAVARIRFEDDATNRRIVGSWPARFDNAYALSLGFVVDEGGMVPIVQRFKDQLTAGQA
ncbi:NAD-P-binding protein [Trametes versicolor FP-101664 SS1]|uniref:NAD-P-binding protein n=1 Tax=Trametes versicolor (strain FP-101664) TaxID=717944 RepID=UPI00046241EE|nr:NAD-P-binding protein [Trametes versicolor FP-101664 SS1]EIW59611.1 NAD-P-binding protein [Trametes versicolor FP-101664 SS1]